MRFDRFERRSKLSKDFLAIIKDKLQFLEDFGDVYELWGLGEAYLCTFQASTFLLHKVCRSFERRVYEFNWFIHLKERK